jgi:hypothetical protein
MNRRVPFARRLSLAIAVAYATTAAAQGPAPLGSVAMGSLAVGLRVIWVPSPATPPAASNDTCARRLRVLFWYPAVSRLRRQSTLATYVAATRSTPPESGGQSAPGTVDWATATASDFATDSATASQLADLGATHVDSSSVATILATPTIAVPRASRARGRYPLVVLGNGSAPPFYIHWALAEYLAARGYAVVALAGAVCDEPRSFNLNSVVAMSRDMKVVAASLAAERGVNTDRLGLVGWSVGALAQAFMAATNASVRAIVSLDGGTGYEYGRAILDSATRLDRSRFDAAFVHLTGDATPSRVVAKSFAFYDSLAHGPAYLLHVKALNHAQFTSLGVLVRATDPSTARSIVAAYGYTVQYAGWFLDAYVKGDDRAKARLADPWPILHASRNDITLVKRSARGE